MSEILFICLKLMVPTAYYQFVNDFNARGYFWPIEDKKLFSIALKEQNVFQSCS